MVTFGVGLVVGVLLGVCCTWLVIMRHEASCPICGDCGMGDEAARVEEVRRDQG